MKHIRSSWTDALLICGKCSRKLQGGFGKKRKTRLSKFLRKGLSLKKKKRKAPLGIVEVGCLDVCPKRGVTVVRARKLSDWIVVPEGSSLSDISRQVGLEEHPSD